MPRNRKSSPISSGSKHVTNRNRRLLEHKYGIEIPSDVEYILVGEEFQEWLEEDIDTARKCNNVQEKDYDGIEFID